MNKLLPKYQNLILLLTSLISIGLGEGKYNKQHIKIVKLTNIIFLLVVFMLLFFGILFLVLNAPLIFFTNIIWATGCIICLFLNKFKLFNLAKSTFLFLLQGYLLFIAFVFGLRSSAILLLISTATVPLFIYKSKEYIKIIIFSVISSITYGIINYSTVPFPIDIHFDPFIVEVSNFSCFVVSVCALLIMIYAQKIIGEENEFLLLKEIRLHYKTEQALEEAKRNSEKASMAKTEFLSTISHNIRTPLNAVQGLTNLLVIDNPKKGQLEKLTVLKNSTENLIQLIDNILDFNKIESGKIEVYEFEIDLREIIAEVYNNLLLKAEERNNTVLVKIDENLPGCLLGDDIKINQVLSNLLSNAIKFTDNGEIVLEIKVKNRTSSHVSVYFSVRDSGIGIAKEKQKYIFESFTHMNSIISRKYGGSGLGLAIVKKLVNLMGSEVYVESNLGRGSHFFFELILKVAGEPVSEATVYKEEVKVEKNLFKAKVLIVDDNSMNLMVAETFLKRWNAQVDTAEDGLTAVEKARNNAYDIILMDIQMPQVNGFDASKEIRDFDPNVTILAFTADSYGISKNKIEDYGISDFIVKPFQPDELYKKIEKLLQSYESQEIIVKE